MLRRIKGLTYYPLLKRLYDFLVVLCAGYLALKLRFDGMVPEQHLRSYSGYAVPVALVWSLSYHFWGVYKCSWGAPTVGDVYRIGMAATAASGLTNVLLYLASGGYPRGALLLADLLTLAFTLGPRLLLASKPLSYRASGLSNTLIVGTGTAGLLIAREIMERPNASQNIIGFVDDDPAKKGMSFFGIRVLGSRLFILDYIRKYSVSLVLVAMPSAPRDVVRSVARTCTSVGVRCKILPAVYDVIESRGALAALREVNVEDLLDRPEIKTDFNALSGFITGKRVLVTGGGGSIGSEICRQVARLSPASLLVLGHGENSIHDILQDLSEEFPGLHLEFAIASVRDSVKIDRVFHEFQPQLVFHAAAHKHVPLMETDPREAVMTNVMGTWHVAQAAIAAHAECMVLISTDKAVYPSSVMGATKRVAEMVLQAIKSQTDCKFVTVRFGNVLGSRGSVVPLFRKQIARGGPVTVTHPEMTRFFMTIPEAVSLVLQAASMSTGNEVYILDMGRPVRILDLARSVITLSGYVPDEDIRIVFTGIRPGEKLHEELAYEGDGLVPSAHSDIFTSRAAEVIGVRFWDDLNTLFNAVEPDDVRAALKRLIPDYGVEHSAQREVAAAGATQPLEQQDDQNDHNGEGK